MSRLKLCLAPLIALAIPVSVTLAFAQTTAPASKPATTQPPAPAVKPYKPVAVKLPEPVKDPSFESFRKQLADIAQKKDRAALTKLIVARGFFWEAEEGDKADKKKSGFDNLSAAIKLGGNDADGWEILLGYASIPTAMPLPQRGGTICAPADPAFDDKELEDVAKATNSDPAEWGYPLTDHIEVRAKPQADAPVVEKLGMHFIRVMTEDDTPPSAQDQAPMVRVATPSGKTGYVSVDAIAPLGNDQLCYVKDAGGWKITGYVGAGDQ